jgi:hypothetical protein
MNTEKILQEYNNLNIDEQLDILNYGLNNLS